MSSQCACGRGAAWLLQRKKSKPDLSPGAFCIFLPLFLLGAAIQSSAPLGVMLRQWSGLRKAGRAYITHGWSAASSLKEFQI